LQSPRWIPEVTLDERHAAHQKYVGKYEDLGHYLDVLYRHADREAALAQEELLTAPSPSPPPPPPPPPAPAPEQHLAKVIPIRREYVQLLEEAEAKDALKDPEVLEELDAAWDAMDDAARVRAEEFLKLTERVRYPGNYLVEDYEPILEKLSPLSNDEQSLFDAAMKERRIAIESWKVTLKEYDRIIWETRGSQRVQSIQKRRLFTEKIRASQRVKELAG